MDRRMQWKGFLHISPWEQAIGTVTAYAIGNPILHQLRPVGQASTRSQTCCKACCSHVEACAMSGEASSSTGAAPANWVKYTAGQQGGGRGWMGVGSGCFRTKRAGWRGSCCILSSFLYLKALHGATWIYANDWAGTDLSRLIGAAGETSALWGGGTLN